MKDKIRIDSRWVQSNSDDFRLGYSGSLSDYQKKRIGEVCKKEIDNFFGELDSNRWQIRTFSFLPLFKQNEYSFVSDTFEDMISKEKDREFKRLINSVIDKMRSSLTPL